jgi:hypothetical protein
VTTTTVTSPDAPTSTTTTEVQTSTTSSTTSTTGTSEPTTSPVELPATGTSPTKGPGVPLVVIGCALLLLSRLPKRKPTK